METGTHQELVEHGGHYARLYEVQARSDSNSKASNKASNGLTDVTTEQNNSGDKAA